MISLSTCQEKNSVLKDCIKLRSAPDSSSPFLALDPFGVASFVVAEARSASGPRLDNLFPLSSLFS